MAIRPYNIDRPNCRVGAILVIARLIGMGKLCLFYSCGAHSLTLTLSLQRERADN